MTKLFAKIKKATKPVKMKNMENHNLRIKDCPKVDAEKSHLNTYEGTKDIVKYVKAKEKECNAALKKAGKRKIRKDANLLFECVVAPGEQEFFDRYNDNEFFADVDEFFNGYIKDGCIAQKCIHRDESTYHAHYLIIPYWEEGINYNKYFANPEMCSQFQQALYDYLTIEKGYEFDERELAKNTKRKHKEVKEWYKEVGKSSNMVEALTDDNKRTEYAIKGVQADTEKKTLQDKINSLSIENSVLSLENDRLQTEKEEIEEKYMGLKKGVMQATKGNEKFVDEMEHWGIHQLRIEKEKEEKERNKDYVKEEEKEM